MDFLALLQKNISFKKPEIKKEYSIIIEKPIKLNRTVVLEQMSPEEIQKIKDLNKEIILENNEEPEKKERANKEDKVPIKISVVLENSIGNINMDNLIAKDDDDYLNIAISLSKVSNLKEIYGRKLRARALSSPLFNTDQFTRDFEELITEVYNKN